jgi:hypothetical protein
VLVPRFLGGGFSGEVGVFQPSCFVGRLQTKCRVRLAFVSACYSLWAGNVFVAAGVPHVVCIRTSDRILEAAALRFTQAFYTSLAVGDSVQEAFNIAKKGVESQPELAVGGFAPISCVVRTDPACFPVFVCSVRLPRLTSLCCCLRIVITANGSWGTHCPSRAQLCSAFDTKRPRCTNNQS